MDELEEGIRCPACGAMNHKGAAICAQCGRPLTPGQEPAPQPRRVLLQLPVMRGVTWGTYGLLAVNVLVWLAMTLAGGSDNPQVLLNFGAKYGPAILAGEYWRLFTPMFLHIGFLHLAFNSYALYILGPEVERFFGHTRFLVIYLLTGILSSVASYLFDSSLAAGASGAIFGLVGALTAFYYAGRQVLGKLGQSRLNNLLGVVVINLLIGFTVPNIDNWAHLGGLVSGLLIGWVIAPRYIVAPDTVPVAVPMGEETPVRMVDRVSLGKRWWVIPLALLVGVGFTLLGNVRESSTASGYMESGRQALTAGEWTAAVDAFDQALVLDPDLASAYVYRAEAFIQLEQYGAAWDDYQSVIDAQPEPTTLAAAYAGRGRLVMLQGDPSMALIDLNQAVSIAPKDSFSRLVRGLIYFDIGQPALARDDLTTALDLGLADEQSESLAQDVLGQIAAAGY